MSKSFMANAQNIQKNWYVVDATWDDQNTGLCYDYFLCGDKSPCFNGLTFAQDHIKENIRKKNFFVCHKPLFICAKLNYRL